MKKVIKALMRSKYFFFGLIAMGHHNTGYQNNHVSQKEKYL